MLKTLTSKRWLIWLGVATLWAIICVIACRWQWGRWEEKGAIEHRITANYDAPAVTLNSVMTTERAPSVEDEWKQVRAEGSYDQDTMLVRNRPGNDGNYGFQVVNLFTTTDGMTVAVDRGWVPNGLNARTPSSIPAAPKGVVTVTGWTRPSEESLGRAEVPGQLASISVADIERMTGRTIAQGYLRMRSERTASGQTPPRPTALDKPTQSQAAGINLSYSIQWALGAVAGYAFVFMRARREHLDSQALAGVGEGSTEQGQDGLSTEHARGLGSKKSPRPAKPRKVRIWDEEDY